MKWLTWCHQLNGHELEHIQRDGEGQGRLACCSSWGHRTGHNLMTMEGFPGGSDGKDSACNAGDLTATARSERFCGEGNGNPLQYTCLENSRDRGAWRATVHGAAKSWTRLSDFTFFLMTEQQFSV